MQGGVGMTLTSMASTASRAAASTFCAASRCLTAIFVIIAPILAAGGGGHPHAALLAYSHGASLAKHTQESI